MSNLPKNLLLALTLACVVALIAFFIQLIIINTGVDPEEPSSVISDEQNGGSGRQNGDSETGNLENGDPEEGGDLTTTPPPEESQTEDPSTEEPPTVALGTRRELLVAQDTRLVVYTNDELFNFTANAFDWVFEYTGDGAASLFITTIPILDQSLEAHVNSFLISYTGGLPVEFGGEVQILDSALRGYHASAHSEYETYEAWIHDLNMQDYDLALVFVINYTSDSHRNLLYAMLSSMSFA